MDFQTRDKPSEPVGVDLGLLHLAGPAAEVRQVLAAHFVRECPHILEIGGHLRPITPYLTHRPLSVLSVDPKTPPLEADTLNGHPCKVRHISRKFQEVAYDYEPQSYGLVLVGYSLKPFGRREPIGDLFFSLIDNARVVVVEYSPELERAASQVPHIINRPGLRVFCSFDMQLNDHQIAASNYARRRFFVLGSGPEHGRKLLEQADRSEVSR